MSRPNDHAASESARNGDAEARALGRARLDAHPGEGGRPPEGLLSVEERRATDDRDDRVARRILQLYPAPNLSERGRELAVEEYDMMREAHERISRWDSPQNVTRMLRLIKERVRRDAQYAYIGRTIAVDTANYVERKVNFVGGRIAYFMSYLPAMERDVAEMEMRAPGWETWGLEISERYLERVCEIYDLIVLLWTYECMQKQLVRAFNSDMEMMLFNQCRSNGRSTPDIRGEVGSQEWVNHVYDEVGAEYRRSRQSEVDSRDLNFLVARKLTLDEIDGRMQRAHEVLGTLGKQHVVFSKRVRAILKYAKRVRDA